MTAARDRRDDEQQGEGKGRKPSGPRLFLSYWPKDVGERGGTPPPGVPWYWCPSIRIFQPDGTRYTGGVLPRDGESSVQIAVANGGTEPAFAKVRLFWCNPTVGFGQGHLRSVPLLTQPVEGIDVPPGEVVLTAPVPMTPDDTTPDHFCLVAEVSAIGDDPNPAKPWAAAADRHYGQHNVTVVHLQADVVTSFPFFVTNPFEHEPARVVVTIRPADRAQVETVAGNYPGVEAGGLEPQSLALASGRRPRERTGEITLELGPGDRAPCHALIDPGVVGRGSLAVAEITMVASAPERDAPDRTGELGLVVFAPANRR